MVKIRFGLIIFSLLSILTWLPKISPVQAADCKTDGDTICLNPGYLVSCSFTASSGVKNLACCSSSTSCTQFKQELANGSTTLTGGLKPFAGRQIWNPEGSCKDGIDTALGCLPYKSENGEFTTAILTFLAGITGAISLAVMLAATIQIMTAGGNPEQVKKGKELLTGAVTGLLFIIFSVTMLRLVAGDIIKLEGF